MYRATHPCASFARARSLFAALIVAIAFVPATASASPASTTNSSATDVGAGEPAREATKLSIDGRTADRNSLRGDGVSVRGRVTGAHSRNVAVSLQVRRVGSRSWRTVVSKRAQNGRKFSLRWRGGRPGRYLSRIVARNAGRSAVDRLGAVFVYRATFASWYGPGFMGNRTACGQRLTSSIVGVAHKTLPCGTRVTFHLRGRTVSARVIDRGPYAHGRDWDLTPALKRKLGFGSTGTVHTTS